MVKTLFAFIALSFFAAHCANKKISSQQCLQGKVIRTSCASIVVQIINNDSIGEDGWKNSMTDTAAVYDNVISVANICKLPTEVKTGQTIYFNIAKPQPSDCVTCMMYDAPPKVQYDLLNVSTKPCEPAAK